MNLKKNSPFYELDRGNLFGAQQLFREEVKTNPCHHTLHNLGVFYLYEGLMSMNTREEVQTFLVSAI